MASCAEHVRNGRIEALGLAPRSRNAEVETALALALAGDLTRAESLALELENRFPLHMQMRFYWIPTIQAEVVLARSNAFEAI